MSNPIETFYNSFSIFYPLVDIFLKPQKKVLLKEINELPEGRLLEIGIGNGTHLPLYKKHEITGIDTSAEMLEKAGRRENMKAELIKMSGEALLFPNESFDYVVASHVVAVVEDPDKLLQEAYRVLKPNGKILILNHFTPDNWLKHLDKAVASISTWFHFRSFFHISDLSAIRNFRLLKEISFGRLGYFNLLILQKK